MFCCEGHGQDSATLSGGSSTDTSNSSLHPDSRSVERQGSRLQTASPLHPDSRSVGRQGSRLQTASPLHPDSRSVRRQGSRLQTATPKLVSDKMRKFFVKYEGNNSSKYDGKTYETDTKLVASLNGVQIDCDVSSVEFHPGDRVSIKHGKSKSSRTWLGIVVDPIGQETELRCTKESGQCTHNEL